MHFQIKWGDLGIDVTKQVAHDRVHLQSGVKSWP